MGHWNMGHWNMGHWNMGQSRLYLGRETTTHYKVELDEEVKEQVSRGAQKVLVTEALDRCGTG